jgi:NTP pyrophosphatase (non-canonical NTP hydrolase)
MVSLLTPFVKPGDSAAIGPFGRSVLINALCAPAEMARVGADPGAWARTCCQTGQPQNRLDDRVRWPPAARHNAPARILRADSIDDLTQALQRFADERDWARFHAPKNLASALVVEAAELLEPFQWLSEADSRTLPPEKLQAVSDEMADVRLYLVQLSSALQVDLLAAARAKLARNALKYPVDRAHGNARQYHDL